MRPWSVFVRHAVVSLQVLARSHRGSLGRPIRCDRRGARCDRSGGPLQAIGRGARGDPAGAFQFSTLPPAAYGFADSAWSLIDTTGGRRSLPTSPPSAPSIARSIDSPCSSSCCGTPHRYCLCGGWTWVRHVDQAHAGGRRAPLPIRLRHERGFHWRPVVPIWRLFPDRSLRPLERHLEHTALISSADHRWLATSP